MSKEKVTFTINDVPELKKDIEQMQKKHQQQIDQLTNNWNELEEYIELQRDEYSNEDKEYWHINKILEYMKEIKEGGVKDDARYDE